MGLFGNVGDAVKRGRNATERSARTASLRIQLNDLLKKRTGLVSQLGASLYEDVRSNPELRKGREALFEGIEQVDAQRKRIEEEIAEIEAAANEARLAAKKYICPRCKTSVGATDLFCMGCGLAIDQVKVGANLATSRADALNCPHCGASVSTGDLFCMECGARLECVEPSSCCLVDCDSASGAKEVDCV